MIDLGSEQLTHVDTDRYAHPQRSMNPAWSSDSRWLAYARWLENHLHVIMLFDTETGQTHRLSDEEKAAEEKEKKEEGQSEESQGQALAIDFDGISRRIVDAPALPLRDYSGLVKGPEGQVFVLENVPNQTGSTVHRYSLEDRKPTQFLERVNTITASHDRKKLLYRSGSNWNVADADRAVSSEGGKRLNVGGMRIHVDPRAEWRQMLRDGWRLMRDFLYVDNVHGAPWDDVWQWYSPWLKDVNHRTDFNYLLDIVSGEVGRRSLLCQRRRQS